MKKIHWKQSALGLVFVLSVLLPACSPITIVPTSSSYESFFPVPSPMPDIPTPSVDQQKELDKSFPSSAEGERFVLSGLQLHPDIANDKDGKHFYGYDLSKGSFCYFDLTGKVKWLKQVQGITGEWRIFWSPERTVAVCLPPVFPLILNDTVWVVPNPGVLSKMPRGAIWNGWLGETPLFWEHNGPNTRLMVFQPGAGTEWISPPFSYRNFQIIDTASYLLPTKSWPTTCNRWVFFQAGDVANHEPMEVWAYDLETKQFLQVGLVSQYVPLAVIDDQVLFGNSQENDQAANIPSATGIVLSRGREFPSAVIALDTEPTLVQWLTSDLFLFDLQVGDYIGRYLCRLGEPIQLKKLNLSPSPLSLVSADKKWVWDLFSNDKESYLIRYALPTWTEN